MNELTTIRNMAAASSNGMITSRQVRDAGIHPFYLQQLVRSGELTRISRGLYMRSDAWEDDLFLFQQRYQRGVFSHDTALYLHGFSDRTPARYTMTFPVNYHSESVESEPLIIHRTLPKYYPLGITEIQSPSGNLLRVYDLERTLCDIVRGQGSDVQIVNAAMKKYAASKEKDIHKLMQYADQLRVKFKVLRYMEILL